ncbi:MAG: NADH-quinone oxidoreductase subunit L, partial [bacterium]
LGIILSINVMGTVSFEGLHAAVKSVSASNLTAIGLLLFGGAVGKSAQFPLYVWLPDAMEGPTPVSSLIHAATMVTAGVYLIARLEFLYTLILPVGEIVAFVGAFTALFAAAVALVHEDMKRILAYSTVSQLGYMFVGVGLGAYGAGIFHLMTHAFFKGLLFLMAGSVMHALHGELNIFKMDALWEKLPWTGSMAVIGGLGLAGFPLVSGFWSKDEILLAALGHGGAMGWILFLSLAVGALLTAFYTFRMIFVAFWCGTDDVGYDPTSVHEAGWLMLVPMVILAVGSLFGGFFGRLTAELAHHTGGHHPPHTIVMSTSVAVSLGGILLAYLLYVQEVIKPSTLSDKWHSLHRAARQQFYVETVYRTVIVTPLRTTSRFVWTVVDDLIVDGLVNLSGASVDITGLVVRFVQTGRIRHYLVYLTIGFSSIMLLITYAIFGG